LFGISTPLLVAGILFSACGGCEASTSGGGSGSSSARPATELAKEIEGEQSEIKYR
jgi:hypothetical protein